MSGVTSPQGGLTRRSFLKTTGAAAGAAALVGVAGPTLEAIADGYEQGQKEGEGEQIVQTCCRPGCVTGCYLNAHVRDGHVVKTSLADVPDQVYKRACLRGLSHVHTIYSPDRIKYPLKRVGERGSGEWERISWEQAIDEIGSKMLEVKNEIGPKGNAFMSNGGQVAALNGTGGGLSRFKNGFEMQSIDNCVDWGCIPGLNRVYGSGGLYGMSAEVRELEHADMFFVWGMNLTVSNWDRWQHMMRAIDNGAKLVVIDPEFTAIAAKADRYISLRPGSDAALILGMINVIVEEELYDKDFVLRASVAPFLVRKDTGKFLRRSDLGIPAEEGPVNPSTQKPTVIDPCVVWDDATESLKPLDEAESPALRGSFEHEGIELNTAFDLLAERVQSYSPEQVAELCEVDAAMIRDLAIEYANGGTVANMLGFGTNSYDNGVYMGHALATLIVITGNIGKIGTNASYNQNAPNTTTLFNAMFLYPDMKSLTDPTLPLLDLPELMEKGTLEKYGAKFVAPKTLYIAEINAYNNFLNPHVWEESVMPKLDMIVVADRMMSDSASMMADYVLPACHWFECEDIRPDMGSTPYSCYCGKVIDPLYEAKPDFEIMKLLAEKVGIGQYFEGSYEDMLKMVFERQGGPTLEEMREKKLVRTKGEPGEQPYSIDAKNINTPTGRFEFYCENPVSRRSIPLPADLFETNCLPAFVPPRESWPDNPKHDQYPLQLISHRNRTMVHSQYNDARWLREIDPEPKVYINTADAETRSIVSEDYVEVFNDRGHAVLKAIVSEGVRPGTVMYPKGWLGRAYREGNMHELTPIEYDSVAINHSYTDSLVDVVKWEEE